MFSSIPLKNRIIALLVCCTIPIVCLVIPYIYHLQKDIKQLQYESDGALFSQAIKDVLKNFDKYNLKVLNYKFNNIKNETESLKIAKDFKVLINELKMADYLYGNFSREAARKDYETGIENFSIPEIEKQLNYLISNQNNMSIYEFEKRSEIIYRTLYDLLESSVNLSGLAIDNSWLPSAAAKMSLLALPQLSHRISQISFYIIKHMQSESLEPAAMLKEQNRFMIPFFMLKESDYSNIDSLAQIILTQDSNQQRALKFLSNYNDFKKPMLRLIKLVIEAEQRGLDREFQPYQTKRMIF
jgi:hypothetical protein